MASNKWLALAVAALLLTAAPGARAGEPTPADREMARTLMEEGRDARDRNDMRTATDRFQRADTIMHVPTTGFELAKAQAALGMLVEARDTLARVLRTGAPPNEPAPFRAARKSAQALDDSLAPRVPGITITVKGAPPAEAPTVTIDDVEVPSVVIGALRKVNPGHHVVVVKTASSLGKGEVDVQEGQAKDVPITVTVSVTPIAPTPPKETEQPPPPPPPAEHHSHALTFVAFGVAVVGVGVGAVTGLMTLSQKSTLQSECNAAQHCPPSAYSDLDTANTYATVSTIGFIAGGVGAAVGVVSLIVGGSHAAKKDAAASATPAITPWLGVGSAGLHGSF